MRKTANRGAGRGALGPTCVPANRLGPDMGAGASAWEAAYAAAASAAVSLISLTTIADSVAVHALVSRVWGEEELRPSLARAFQHAGCGVYGAADADGGLVGFVLGFLGWNGGMHMHSHMLAVLPEWRSRGVGYSPKLAQRAAGRGSRAPPRPLRSSRRRRRPGARVARDLRPGVPSVLRCRAGRGMDRPTGALRVPPGEGAHGMTEGRRLEVRGIELREVALPLVRPFRTSFGEETDKRAILVRVDAGDVEGWGECVASESPRYSEEWLDGSWLALE